MTCIYCGSEADFEEGCYSKCLSSEHIIVTLQDCDTGSTYKIRYPHKCDPVQLGVVGNKSWREDWELSREYTGDYGWPAKEK